MLFWYIEKLIQRLVTYVVSLRFFFFTLVLHSYKAFIIKVFQTITKKKKGGVKMTVFESLLITISDF